MAPPTSVSGVTRREGNGVPSPPARYPHPSSAAVSAVMRANRKIDTCPELRLRSALHRDGLRFRKHLRISASGLRVTPDIVFPRQHLAVFVDGCFWHGCREHGTQPRVNSGYWAAKLCRNRERDARVDLALREAGWQVVRIWEHIPIGDAVSMVTSAIAIQRGTRDGHG